MEKFSLLVTITLSIFSVTLFWPSKSLSQATEGPTNLTQFGFSKSTLETTTGKMVIFEAGKGEPLLLIHGIGAGASAYNWFTVAPKLAEKYRVIVPDLVGWGESYHPDRYILFDDYVTQIQELAEWVGEPVRIWAQSLSCGFAISSMEKGDFEVEKLVLSTPSGGFDFEVDAFGEQATKYFAGIADSPKNTELYAQLFHQKPAVEDWWRREGFFKGENVPTEIIESNHYNTKLPNAAYSALPFLSGKLRYDIASLLKQVNVPAIMLWGDNEFRINPETQKKIQAVNTDIKSFQIKDTRSGFEIEQPERTLDVIIPFLK